MNESVKEKIQRLKNEYHLAEQAESFRALLAEKRDELEERIQEIKQQMEQETFKLYGNKNKTETEQKALYQKMQIDAQVLNSVKDTKRELDAKLDEYELFSKEITLNLRNELIHAILELSPSQKGEYDKLSMNLTEKLQLQTTIDGLANILSNIHVRLSEIAQERKSVKKMNVLRYLFGKNPNVSITNNLMGIDKSVDEILLLRDLALVQTVEYYAFNRWLSDCFERCQELKELAQQRWGWKKLDHGVIPYKAIMEQYAAKLNEYRLQVEGDIKILRQEIVNWIEKNS